LSENPGAFCFAMLPNLRLTVAMSMARGMPSSPIIVV
jgi:hypothetical protein